MPGRLEMASACALAIFSGKIILNFGISERLRAFRYPIFTRGVVEENGICRATFCESAALWERLSWPLAGKPSQSSLRDASSPEGGAFMHLTISADKAPPLGELAATSGSLRGSPSAKTARPPRSMGQSGWKFILRASCWRGLPQQALRRLHPADASFRRDSAPQWAG